MLFCKQGWGRRGVGWHWIQIRCINACIHAHMYTCMCTYTEEKHIKISENMAVVIRYNKGSTTLMCIFLPPANEVSCQEVYSFSLSICLLVCLFILQLVNTYIKILH